ncbi:MAG: hypothetical protein JRH07_05150 [Deltaproteobacteria bacterium]|nr:hypothetical protein [Deltaproteobacteria bacterium]MBW2121217.1 hypothetical protein [Deltaproteobacteria bacterium]
MKRLLVLIIAVFPLFLFLTAHAQARRGSVEFAIVYSSDIIGQVEPCPT